MKKVVLFFMVMAVLFIVTTPLKAQTGFNLPSVEMSFDEASEPGEVSTAMQLLFLVTILALAPSILLMVTCFTRIIIVLNFIGRALSLQGMPPRQVLVSLAIFLTFFIMAPTIGEINERAAQPYLGGEIGQMEALHEASVPLRAFMHQHTDREELAFFLQTAGMSRPETRADVPIWVLIPAFMLTEIKKAFVMGVLIFIPFVVIDMVVASVLMSMGMMMLPPVMISLPFKILLFVLVDGWTVITRSITETYGVV